MISFDCICYCRNLCSVVIQVPDVLLPTTTNFKNGNQMGDPKNPYLQMAVKLIDWADQCDDGFINSEDEYHVIWSDVAPDKTNGLKYLHHLDLFGNMCFRHFIFFFAIFYSDIFPGCDRKPSFFGKIKKYLQNL